MAFAVPALAQNNNSETYRQLNLFGDIFERVRAGYVEEISDESLIEAAEDLGCSKLAAFWLVTWPLSKNGIIAGCFLVFIPALGEFVIPSLLGGSETLMIGKVLWEEFFNNRDWPVASAVAVILLLILIIPIVLFQRNEQKAREAEGQ